MTAMALSPTKVADYGRCAYKVLLRQRQRVPPSIQFIRGRALHEAARLYWVAGGLPVAAFLRSIENEMERIEAHEGLWLPPGKADSPNEARDEALAEARAIGGALYEWLATAPVPRSLEHPLAVEAGGVVFRGRIDFLGPDGAVWDLKTGRSWSQRDADMDSQLTAYAWLVRANGLAPDRGPTSVRVVCASSRRVTVLDSVRTDEDIARYRARVAAVAAGMSAGVYPPAIDGWWHSPEWCEYWADCPYGGGTP